MLNIKKYREICGISQAEAARRLEISRQAYNNYELGKREADYETLLKLAEIFNTSVESLLRDTVPEPEMTNEHLELMRLFDTLDDDSKEIIARLIVKLAKDR
jgi:transcriptional regulator with XRE-family HTH domain